MKASPQRPAIHSPISPAHPLTDQYTHSLHLSLGAPHSFFFPLIMATPPSPFPPPAALLQRETPQSTAPNASLADLPSPLPPPYTAKDNVDIEAARVLLDALVTTKARQEGTVNSFILLSPGRALHVSEADFIKACWEASKMCLFNSYSAWYSAWYFPTRGFSTYFPTRPPTPSGDSMQD